MPDTKISQPTIAPTRKVFWGAVIGLATAAVLNWADNVAGMQPDWLGFLSEPDVKAIVPVVVGGLIMYAVKDRGV